MKKLFLSAVCIFGAFSVKAQWNTPKPLVIVNNTSLSYYYEIRNHSAFFDGVDDGVINGANGPFYMNSLNSYWNTDIIGEISICDPEILGPYSTNNYIDPSQNGLAVSTYNINSNPQVSNLSDYAQYFRTYYLKGYLYGSGINGPGGGLRYPVPSPVTLAGLNQIPGTSYYYDPISFVLYDASSISYQSMFYMAPGTVSGTPNGFLMQFLEVAGMDYVLCSELPG